MGRFLLDIPADIVKTLPDTGGESDNVTLAMWRYISRVTPQALINAVMLYKQCIGDPGINYLRSLNAMDMLVTFCVKFANYYQSSVVRDCALNFIQIRDEAINYAKTDESRAVQRIKEANFITGSVINEAIRIRDEK